MAFAPKKKIKHREVWEDPELVPFIDMLVVCCCFLLMSASLLQTAVIEISLPSATSGGTTGVSSPQGGELNLSLIITDEGLRVGGAEVSTLHANFIVNTGNATAEDVLTLIQRIQQTVEERTGIRLVPEVLEVGER